MRFTVSLSSDAKRFYDRSDAPLQAKFDRCFAALAIDPRRGNNVKQLAGRYRGYYRYRVGDHHVLYQIHDDQVLVFVADIASRADTYD